MYGTAERGAEPERVLAQEGHAVHDNILFRMLACCYVNESTPPIAIYLYCLTYRLRWSKVLLQSPVNRRAYAQGQDFCI